jgi:hypothetical protein
VGTVKKCSLGCLVSCRELGCERQVVITRYARKAKNRNKKATKANVCTFKRGRMLQKPTLRVCANTALFAVRIFHLITWRARATKKDASSEETMGKIRVKEISSFDMYTTAQESFVGISEVDT